jgi:iron complex outermembrane receptor protein
LRQAGGATPVSVPARQALSSPGRRRRCARRPVAAVLALALLGADHALADDDLHRLKSLSLDELAALEVSVASRRPERLSDVPAAIYVVTADDIRRSGATQIPEVLRMVPGVQVARIDANKWAVSIRGFNGIFSNKLLVLIDGRTVYSPSFSGVFWDIQDTVLDDIERIEVVRGPGASVWGANAVNGVINILTRSARDTVGSLASAGAGNEQRYLALRHGAQLAQGTFLRGYAKVHHQSSGTFPSGAEATDDWTQARAGFRLDSELAASESFTLQGDVYQQNAGHRRVLPDLDRYAIVQDDDINRDGAYLIARWAQQDPGGSARELQAYVDYVHMDQPYSDYKQYVFDVDFTQRLADLGRHNLSWGLSFRYYKDELDEDPIMPFDPLERHDHLYGAFVQDQITLTDDVVLTLGSKLEHNDYSGFEIQPTARLLWHTGDGQSLWGSISRAVRTPSRVEHDGALFRGVMPPAGASTLPTAIRFEGDRSLDSEVLVAYEVGYRTQIRQDLSVDVAAFYNDYQELRSTPLAGVTFDPTPPPHLNAHFQANNDGGGHTYGLEVSADWRPTERWRIQAAYTWLRMNVDSFPDENGRSPEHQLSLRSDLVLGEDVELDLWLRSVGELPGGGSNGPESRVPGYTTLDARLAWQATPELTVSLVGRNLIDPAHPEFVPDFLPYLATEVDREVLLQLRWTF